MRRAGPPNLNVSARVHRRGRVGTLEQAPDLAVAHLAELLVPFPDGKEHGGNEQNHEVVDLRPKGLHGVGRSHPESEDDPTRPTGPQRAEGGEDRTAGRHSIIDQDDGAVPNFYRRHRTSIGPGPTFDLGRFPCDGGTEVPHGVPGGSDPCLIEEPGASLDHGAEPVFRVGGSSDLSDNEYIERSPESSGDLERHGDTAPRQSDHHWGLVSVAYQTVGQELSRLLSIGERYGGGRRTGHGPPERATSWPRLTPQSS